MEDIFFVRTPFGLEEKVLVLLWETVANVKTENVFREYETKKV